MNARRSVKALLTAGLVAGTMAVAAPGVTAAPAAPAAATATTPVYVWASNVNVRHDPADANCWFHPSRSCPVVATVSRVTVQAHCQRAGETVHDSGYTNKWWSYVRTPGGQLGFINNIYLQGGEKIAGVPDCTP
ncbi:peptidase M23 [Streptomyces sp. NPDC015131]|uniref:peptidase M23 n=1 Tax=Streptomyces sp. NPDC015131 TaxID=3364941 RepID=UPI0036F7FF9E